MDPAVLEAVEEEAIAPARTRFFAKPSDFADTVADYFSSFKSWRMWNYMALADIRRRYRRTLIGPFWTTLSLAIFISSMGVLFSILWKTDIKSFLPYFASGFISWTFVSCIITEGCQTFINMEGLLKQISFPFAACAWLVVTRNFWIFLHQITIYIVIAFIYHVPLTRYTFLAFPGLILLFLTGSWVTMLLGSLCARFRDMHQVVISLLQISMFVTPIFWPEAQLGTGFKAYLIVNSNPLYHYVVVVRQPLMGQSPHLISWIIVSVMTVLGWLITMLVMSKNHRKLIFWL
ncbi:MAG: sugar ABC transporter permease [Coxiella sp. RIFCSPHIGHO2_12_FULL_42_15]|nr:MAG: sugar ABC transporter permease [Coxiella sp. RIFCSPHIGHO2_12_FULL_42_15]